MDSFDQIRALAPDMPNLRRNRVLAAVAALVGAVEIPMVFNPAIFYHPSTRALGFGVIFLLGGVFSTVYYWLWPANTRLLIGTGQVGYQDMFGRRRFWPAQQIARVVELQVTTRSRSGGLFVGQRKLLLVGPDGRCLLAFNLEL